VNDDRIHDRIERLVSEEHGFWQREANGSASDDERRRLESLRVSLDQCRDLPASATSTSSKATSN